MLKILPTLIGCIALFSSLAIANEQLKTQNEKSSYVLGIEVAKQFDLSKDDIDTDAFLLGMKDHFANKKPKLNEEEARNAMMNFQDKEREREQEMLKKLSIQNKKEAALFLEMNKKKKGVVALASGLQYKVIKSGDGKVHPKKADTVLAHYHGTLLDGTVFDSSYKRRKPITFPVNGVISGWTEALQKMKVGDKWQLVIPSHLAYGEAGAPPKIAPGSTLLFDIELLEIK